MKLNVIVVDDKKYFYKNNRNEVKIFNSKYQLCDVKPVSEIAKDGKVTNKIIADNLRLMRKGL